MVQVHHRHPFVSPDSALEARPQVLREQEGLSCQALLCVCRVHLCMDPSLHFGFTALFILWLVLSSFGCWDGFHVAPVSLRCRPL